MRYDAVLLVAFGGPTRPEEIRPFLDIVTHGRRIPPARLEEVAHHYERMPGGHSPLNALTRARAALAGVPAERRAWTPLVFTAHSIPVAMADDAPYVTELTAIAHAVAGRLGHRRFSIAYQSRSGAPGDRWLEPDINDVLLSLGNDREQHVVVVPAGFVCDHVEVLYDLDVEARATASAGGLTLHRAAAVTDQADFIASLADLVRRSARAVA